MVSTHLLVCQAAVAAAAVDREVKILWNGRGSQRDSRQRTLWMITRGGYKVYLNIQTARGWLEYLNTARTIREAISTSTVVT